MLKIIHRVNTIKELNKVPKKYGVEIDVRSRDGFLILNHDPFQMGVVWLDYYLEHFKHKFLVVDIKEEGIEEEVIKLLKKHSIKNYFLLGVTPPQMYQLNKHGFTDMANRFSEFELYPSMFYVKWMWLDTFFEFSFEFRFRSFYGYAQLCLVCPSRWGRPEDIEKIKATIKKENLKIDAVMTSLEYADKW